MLAWAARWGQMSFTLAAASGSIVAYGMIYGCLVYLSDARLLGSFSGVTGETWPKLIAALLAYAVALRMVYLGLPELLHEEAYYWNYSRHLDIGYLDHPPMVAWIIRLFTKFLGHHEMAVRMGAFCLWFLGAAYLYRLGKRMFDTPTAAATVLLFTLLPVYFIFGFVMLPDSCLTVCWAAALYYIYCALVEEKPRAWYGVGIALGLGMLSKYTMALLAISLLAFVLLDPMARRRWCRHPAPYLAILISLLLFLPVIIWNAQHEWASFQFQGPRRFLAEFHFAFQDLIGSILLLLTPVGIVSIVTAASGRRIFSVESTRAEPGKQDRVWRLFMTLTFSPLAVFFIFSLLRMHKLNWTGPLWLGLLPYVAHLMTVQPSTSDGRLRRWSHHPWPATAVTLLVVYGAGMLHLTLGVPALPYPINQLGLGWYDLAAQLEMKARDVALETGMRPLLVGMDIDRTSSWLAFYTARVKADKGDRDWDTVVEDIGGQHLFGGDSHMYQFWCPSDLQIKKPMILVANNINEIRNRQIDSRIGRSGPVREMVAVKNGRGTARSFYRVVYGYKGSALGGKPE